MLLTKFGKNLIKHVEEETSVRRRKKKRQDPSKLGGTRHVAELIKIS